MGDDTRSLRPPSLLEVIDAKQQRDEPRQCYTHVLYVATTQDTKNAEEFHREVISELQSRGNEQKVTGILLIQDGVLIHYYEASPPTSIAFLRHLNNFSDGHIGSLRVLMSSEDCDRRHVSDWQCKSVEVPDETGVSVPDSSSSENDEVANLAFEVFSNILRIAEGQKATQLCPSKQRLESFTQCKGFFTLQEYLGVFDSGVSCTLDSELGWPYQQTVDYRKIN